MSCSRCASIRSSCFCCSSSRDITIVSNAHGRETMTPPEYAARRSQRADQRWLDPLSGVSAHGYSEPVKRTLHLGGFILLMRGCTVSPRRLRSLLPFSLPTYPSCTLSTNLYNPHKTGSSIPNQETYRCIPSHGGSICCTATIGPGVYDSYSFFSCYLSAFW
jgi:hypothetical protein